MMIDFQDKGFKWFFGVGLVLFFLIIREAIFLPLTHDEYSTILVSYQPLWDIITYKDPIPNNHILNTILLKCNIIIFGDHLISNRLHNILSFIPYFVFSVLIARKLSRNTILSMMFVLMVNFQPFVLDFFCVTRGYGLSIAFQMASLYYALEYISNSHSKHYGLALLFGAIGVMANFTLLNFYIPLLGLLIYYSFKGNSHQKQHNFKKELVLGLGITLLLALISILPISKMVNTNQFVFWSSNNFFNDTIVPLFTSLRVGVFYFHWSHTVYSIVLIVLLSFLVLLVAFVSKNNLRKNKYLLFSSFLLLLVLIYNNMQFYLLKVPFLNARTSLFFVPLVALFLYALILTLSEQSIKLSKGIAIFIIVVCTQHFVRGYNGKVNYEWYFNQNTYEVLDEIYFLINSKNLSTPVTLDCHWFYHPSLTYHINQKYRGLIELTPYHKETDQNSNAMFYYSDPSETELLSKNYDKVKEFSGSYSILWQKKQ
ncbi:MAG: hypothetical protein H6567_00780 [Lewinellaceae bacterium]|nr:hypothetical protein [Lewinellaceae bacterium]